MKRTGALPRGALTQKGFVLIEATIAFLLVSIGIVGLMMVSVRGSRASQESFERTEAINLASVIATKVRATGDGFRDWDGIDVNKPSTWPSGLDAATVTALNELKDNASTRFFDARATVTLRAPDGVSVCTAVPCEMVVSVDWTGASESARQYQLYGWVGM